jgi:uncharacterized protein
MTNRLIFRTAATSAALMLVLSGCGGGRQEASGGDAGQCQAGSGTMTIATGNSTGVYYVLGGGMAKLFTDKTDLTVTAAETGASVQNIEGVVKGDYDIAFSLADSATDAVQGKESFQGQQPVKALTRLYDNYTHVVVRKASGITSVAEMKGKRISTGSPKSGTEVIAQRLLKSAGLDPAKDVKAQRLGLEQTVSGMKDGSVDGFFWSGGLPTAAVKDVTTSMKNDVVFLDIASLLPKMKEYSELYAEGNIGKDAYGTAADTPTIVTPNVLLVKDSFDAGNACALTKLVHENIEQLKTVHKSASEIKLENADETTPIPLHTGAEQAIKELRGGS